MKETQQYTNIHEYHQAMSDQSEHMGDLIDSHTHTELRDHLTDLNETVKEHYPYKSMLVITGEQPYGALGGTKVLGKRILAQTLSETYGDVATAELFTNHDLVGSEPGFFRMVIPTLGSAEGIVNLGVLSGKLRQNGVTASGIVLPNEKLQEQVNTIRDGMHKHYPTTQVYKDSVGFDPDITHRWAGAYGIQENGEFDPKSTPDNYAQAHIDWLTGFEKSIGLEMDQVIKEGDFDLALARNGGIEVLDLIWKRGLINLRNNNYDAVALKTDESALQATPFNLSENGVRLQTSYTNGDNSLIEAINPVTKERSVITMDQAVSGRFGFSFKAVPRVVIYSLSGIHGHITGGGSVYNIDAQSFMKSLQLPYFPIIHMHAHDGEQQISSLQYASIATTRKAHERANSAVRQGKVSLLDLAMSCHLEEIKSAIKNASEIGGDLKPDQVITIPNKANKIPNI
jgi:hypothetical protein